jgi:hypothetical protein
VRHTYLINYVLYQAGWFACVFGAAWGYPFAGFLIAALLIVVHFWLADERAVELRLLVLVVLVGLTVEVVQHATATYRFVPAASGAGPGGAPGGVPGVLIAGLPPPWLLALWAQLATTMRFSLRHVFARLWLSLAFGAVGGPLAFLAGERLGAITLSPPLTSGLIHLSLCWAVAMMLFHIAGLRLRSTLSNPPQYRPWRRR